MLRRIVFALPLLLGLIGWTTGLVGASRSFELEIPAIGVKTSVINLALTQQADGSKNWNMDRLRLKVGYLEGTAWFGAGGNVVLGGHSEWQDEPDVFYDLHQVALNDEIIVRVGDQTRLYRVAEIRLVPMTDIGVLYGNGHEQLTLITCARESRQPDGIYTQRIVVIANPVP